MKKLNRLIIALMCLLLLSACNGNAPQDQDIHVFYTSDVHCGVDENLGFAKLKALINDTKEKHNYVALVDLGDYIQGGTYGTLSRGSLIIEMMNSMDYDVVTIGNHEFDYGLDRLKELMKMANFPFVAANVRYTGKKESAFKDVPEFIIKQYGRKKIAFVGILLPTSITSATPVDFMENGEFVYNFYLGHEGRDFYEKIQSTVNEARRQGADYVIALSHLGSLIEYTPYDSISLISHTTGIDVVLDGHSHSVIIGDHYPNAEGKDVLLSSVGTKMENAGELIIGKDGTITSLLISEYNREDETVREAINNATGQLNEILTRKVGQVSFDLMMTDENGIRLIRNRETNLGDFVADAVRDFMNTDVTMYNGGSIRASIKAGDVTYNDLLNVLPFFDSLSAIRCKGQDIIDALEFCSKNTETIISFEDRAVGEFGGFMQVSGLKYTINASIPSSITVDDNGMFTGVAGERRVTDVMILKGYEYVPIDPNAYYTVSSNRYMLLQNGDGNTAFDHSAVLVDRGPVELDALIAWMEKAGNNMSEYAQPQGRITVK